MGIFFDSDKVGIAFGLVVFLVMILMGLHGNVSAAVVISRALVGFTVAYVLGFVLSKWITSALITALATERAEKVVREDRQQETEEEEKAATEPESETS